MPRGINNDVSIMSHVFIILVLIVLKNTIIFSCLYYLHWLKIPKYSTLNNVGSIRFQLYIHVFCFCVNFSFTLFFPFLSSSSLLLLLSSCLGNNFGCQTVKSWAALLSLTSMCLMFLSLTLNRPML